LRRGFSTSLLADEKFVNYRMIAKGVVMCYDEQKLILRVDKREEKSFAPAESKTPEKGKKE